MNTQITIEPQPYFHCDQEGLWKLFVDLVVSNGSNEAVVSSYTFNLGDLIEQEWEYYTFNGEFPDVVDWKEFRSLGRALRIAAERGEVKADLTPITPRYKDET